MTSVYFHFGRQSTGEFFRIFCESIQAGPVRDRGTNEQAVWTKEKGEKKNTHKKNK